QRDKIVFDITNDGNVKAFPIVKVKNNAENGYIGLVNTSGALEIGDREETDTGIVKKSEILMDFRGDKISTGFSQALKNQGVTNDNTEYVVGTAERINLWERPHIKLKNLRGETKLHNYATSLTWTITNDSVG
ncbi:phage tail family protein, partial [Streptococcus pneumoniae]|nr:phage tail family protein [Streptococcus pneumoniae]